LKKQIAGALVASLLIGSAPAGAQEGTATANSTVEDAAQRQEFRDSIDRVMGRAMEGKPGQAPAGLVPREPNAAGPQLTPHERRDLEKRRAALQTDPVARGTGSLILILVSVAASIAITAWAIDKYSNEDDTIESMARRR
jgi:hypothetical protein